MKNNLVKFKSGLENWKSNSDFANDSYYHYLMGNDPLDFIKISKINGNRPLDMG